MDLGDHTNAIKYIKLAIDKDMEEYEKEFGGLEHVFQMKINSLKIDKRIRERQKVLSRKIRKLNLYIYNGFKPGDTAAQTLLSETTSNLKKLIYPRVLNL